jgi:ELWxxDGT repeat protein
LLAADLTGLVTAHTLADPSVPTNVETATVQVKNQGTTAATVSTQVRVYASTDSTFSTSDVLLGTTTTTALSAGSSRNVLVNLTMPNTLAAGTYKLLSRVDATNVVAEGTTGEANNTGVGPSFTVAWQFGTVPGRTGNTVLTLKDVDGTVVTFKLTGPGVGTVVKDGTNWDLKLTGTTTASAVTITTSGGNGRVTLNDIQTAGPLASFTAATTDVNGTVAINGTITTLTLGDVLGGNVAAKSITTFTARNLTNAKLYIGTTLGQDGKLGGTSTNLDTYGLGRLNAFVLTGSMTGSTVRVSVNPVDGIFGNGNDKFVTGTPTGIGSITIQGALSADSRFITPTKPSTYLLAGLTKTTTGDSHFVTNLTNLAPITANDAFTVKNSSGTPVQLTDVDVTSRPRSLGNLVNVNGTVYFTAYRPDLGWELWKSDGTPTGTVLVKDIVSGTGSSNPEQLINVNGTLFFTAETAAEGRELWKSNAAGTFRVKDINPGTGYGISHLLTDTFINVNGTLFFTADNGDNGVELWKSDGTDVGTVMVKDIYLGSSTSYPNLLTSFKGMLFFTAFNTATGMYDLWKSDGTGPGTQVFRHFYSMSSQGADLTVVGNNLYFTADDGVHGEEVWKTDGTTAGTVLLKDVNAFTGVGVTGSNPANLTNVNGKLFFTANDQIHGTELWMSDGTATVLVRDITPGTSLQSNSTSFTDLTGVGNQLFFRAFAPGVTGQYELWTSDGTESGTVSLGVATPGLANGSPLITDVNGVAYFRAANYDLWKSDGTVAGTKLVMAGANVRELVNVNGTLFISSQVSNGLQELWKISPANALLNGNVLTNDRDPNGNPLTAALVTGPTKGTLTLNANGTFSYRPNAGFIGTDSFTYRASDGLLQSTPATVTITVTA